MTSHLLRGSRPASSTLIDLLTLYEQGKFQLRDPLDKYIPAFAKEPEGQDDISVDARLPEDPGTRGGA